MNNKTIIFYRNERGIGDACMLKPTVEYYQNTTESEIVVVMNEPASAVFKHSGVTIIPVSLFDIADYENAMFFNVSRCCLNYELAKRYKLDKSRFDLFAMVCNATIESHGNITVTDAEILHIYDRYPILKAKANGFNMVGIVVRSAQEWRSYQHWKLVAEYFNRFTLLDNTSKKVVPIIIDHEQPLEGFNCTKDLDIRETIVLISQLDLVIGPDTGPMHVAGTLGIPTLWLFGPTDPRLRVGYYPEANVIWKPCNKDRVCWYDYCEKLNCLWKISPWEVVRKAKRILHACTT